MPSPGLCQWSPRFTQENIGLGVVLEKPEQPLIPEFNTGRTPHGRFSRLFRKAGAIKALLDSGNKEHKQRLKASGYTEACVSALWNPISLGMSPACVMCLDKLCHTCLRQWAIQAWIRMLGYKKELLSDLGFFRPLLGARLVQQFFLSFLIIFFPTFPRWLFKTHSSFSII